jgi:hypothetical protein
MEASMTNPLIDAACLNIANAKKAWRKEADEACARHASSVAVKVSAAMMTAALVCPDPAESARYFARAMEWQTRAMMFPVMTQLAGFSAAHTSLMDPANGRDERPPEGGEHGSR